MVIFGGVCYSLIVFICLAGSSLYLFFSIMCCFIWVWWLVCHQRFLYPCDLPIQLGGLVVSSSSNAGWGWSPIPCTSCSMFSVQVCFLSILFSVLSKGIRLCYMFHGGFYLDVYLSRVVRLVVSGSFINLPHYEAMSLGYGHQFERRITLVLVLRVIYQARILLGWLCYCYRIHKWKATWERLRSKLVFFARLYFTLSWFSLAFAMTHMCMGLI